MLGAVVELGDVIDDAHPMAQPVSPAECDGLVDGRQAERLTGVNREARVVPSHVFERVEVPGGRVPCLRSGDVETDDTLVAEADCQFGDLPGPGSVTHRGDQAAHGDGASLGGGRLLAVGEAGQHGVDHLVERQAAVDVQFGANRISA